MLFIYILNVPYLIDPELTNISYPPQKTLPSQINPFSVPSYEMLQLLSKPFLTKDCSRSQAVIYEYM